MITAESFVFTALCLDALDRRSISQLTHQKKERNVPPRPKKKRKPKGPKTHRTP